MNQIELIKQEIERLKNGDFSGTYDARYALNVVKSFIESLEKLEEPECQAYKDAKANNSAYIVEDGWIVRVYADNHREKIKKI